MTPATIYLLLGLTLCSLCSWAQLNPGKKASIVKEKPGTCPADVDFPVCEDGILNKTAECATDSDCKEKRKCCLSGCRNLCLLPLEDKKNPCPFFNASICTLQYPGFPNTCHSDEQCPGTERCCCSDCVRQCTPTVRVKIGQCPPPKSKCPARTAKPQCQKDGNCGGKKKCCNLCGKKCVDPAKEHAGFCPVSMEQSSCIAALDKALCSRDVDCPSKQKCCLSDKKMECLDPVKEKNGACPVSVAKCVNPPPPPLCKSDSDCPGDKKCCTPLCRRECTDAIVNKPGKCPVVNMFAPCITPYPPPLCIGDIQCPGRQKCCDYACRQQCAEPAFE